MPSPRELVIYGAGGFARETAQLVRVLPEWRLLGFADDDPGRPGREVNGAPVLGGADEIVKLADGAPDLRLVVCTGSPSDYGSRARIVARLGLPAERYATLVHPGAWVSESSRIGPGTVVHAHTVVTAAARIGAHVAIMPQVTVTHDDVIEDYATIASGVRLGGTVRVGAGAYLGAGALIKEGLTVGAGALVGMGSVVLRDVPPGETWVGSPAHRLRPATLPSDSSPGSSDDRR